MRYCKYTNSNINNVTIYFFYLYTIFDEVFVFSMKNVFLVLFRGFGCEVLGVRFWVKGVVFTGEQVAYFVGDSSQAQNDKGAIR
jgi:hypothetical protein